MTLPDGQALICPTLLDLDTAWTLDAEQKHAERDAYTQRAGCGWMIDAKLDKLDPIMIRRFGIHAIVAIKMHDGTRGHFWARSHELKWVSTRRTEKHAEVVRR